MLSETYLQDNFPGIAEEKAAKNAQLTTVVDDSIMYGTIQSVSMWAMTFHCN